MVKLVRDRIPEIIESKGEMADFYVADEQEYFQRLKEKLSEEAIELATCTDALSAMEEMADVLEVLEAVREYWGILEKDVVSAKENKKQKRGGFAKRYILK